MRWWWLAEEAPCWGWADALASDMVDKGLKVGFSVVDKSRDRMGVGQQLYDESQRSHGVCSPGSYGDENSNHGKADVVMTQLVV